MQQYFIKGESKANIFIEDKDTAKHMFSVMRLQKDDQVVLVFDDGLKHIARVVDPDKQHLELVRVLEEKNSELPVNVTLAMGFPKGDKLEWISQKATELGAHSIWAYPADWSVVKWDSKKLGKRQDKLEKIVKGAAEQSKRNFIPTICLFEKKQDFLKKLESFDYILIAYEESAKEGETSALAKVLRKLKPGQNILFIFGPEGGISPEEIAHFEQLNGVKVGLGPRIMRAETAPLYALSAISFAVELDR